jgi:hypothetical protein
MTQQDQEARLTSAEAKIATLERRVLDLERKLQGKASQDVEQSARRGFGEGHGGELLEPDPKLSR